MDIYITNLETKQMLRLPMLPEEINGKIGNRFTSYSVLKNGEVKLETGTSLDTFSWDGMFPGKHRKKDPYIRKWVSPKKCDIFFRNLKASSGKPRKAKLLITDTKINLNVYLQDYSPVESGGYGDISYSVTFVKAKSLVVEKVAAKKKTTGNNKNTGKKKDTKTAKTDKRTSPPAAKTYTVRSGDCLWKIAQKFYGNGALYTKIYSANKGVIGSNPNLIYPGQVLKIP